MGVNSIGNRGGTLQNFLALLAAMEAFSATNGVLAAAAFALQDACRCQQRWRRFTLGSCLIHRVSHAQLLGTKTRSGHLSINSVVVFRIEITEPWSWLPSPV